MMFSRCPLHLMIAVLTDCVEWRSEYKSVRQKVSGFDRDAAKTIQLSKLLNGFVKEVEKIDMEREREREKILREIGQIRSETRGLNEKLKSFERTPAYL